MKTSTTTDISYYMTISVYTQIVQPITQYVKYEWYFESGFKYNSSNVYCKEIVDAKIAALEAENAALKEQIQNLYNLYEQIRG